MILLTPINADYSALTEKIETNLKAPKIKVNDGVRISKYMNIFRNQNIANWSRKKKCFSILC